MVPLFGRDPAVSVARPMSLKGSGIRAVKAVLPRMPRDAISITKTNRVFRCMIISIRKMSISISLLSEVRIALLILEYWDLPPWIANSPIPINHLTYAENCMNS
ncbi:hypothetical protein CEXT_208561 [Caerostris extrusa]|uniref:Uncharacterized protein n=1 Tax=Caerostris extrusa TaxID=172846 RepID=A0AAV4XIR6_CAEEX|nr:hypothetical protein CEXT_208561 [Caerostris extrusa]